MLPLALVIVCSTAVFASVPLLAQDCNSSPNKILHIENQHLERYPIKVPGNNTFDLDIQVLQPINGNHHELRLTLSTKVLFGWMLVPCFEDPSKNFCTFELCDFVRDRCPKEIAKTTPDFQCTCPLQPGTYHIYPTPISLHMPHNPWLHVFIGQPGDFKARIEVTDTITNEEVACYNLQWSIVNVDCQGIQCLIGKK